MKRRRMLDVYTKLVVSRSDPTTVFCLDKAGKIHTVCSTTLVRFFTWAPYSKEVMEDFVLLEDEVLTMDKMKEEFDFQILEFPSFTTTYRPAVSCFSKLVVAVVGVPASSSGGKHAEIEKHSYDTRLSREHLLCHQQVRGGACAEGG